MKKTSGGGISQNAQLAEFEKTMGVTAKRAAELLNTSYNTYKEWKGNRRNMTGPSSKLCLVLTALKDTQIGRKFGV